MEMKAEDLKIDMKRKRVGETVKRKTKAEEIVGTPKFKFSPGCPICSLEDEELQDKIHKWKFEEKRDYNEIIELVYPFVLTQDNLKKHFSEHFPVVKETKVEILSSEGKLRTLYDDTVESKLKPVVEMEKLYDKIANWFDVWEQKQMKEDGKKTLKNSDVEPLVRLSSELKTMLVELNKMRQAETMAKVCVHGFMSRFIKVLLNGLEEVIANLSSDLETKFKIDEHELADTLKKTKTGLARQIQDGARDALIATVQEYGLRG
jgi:hypothetical protein